LGLLCRTAFTPTLIRPENEHDLAVKTSHAK
jgi:hypothetical protein